MFQVTTYLDRPGYQRVSSTLWKQREDYCASLIQKAWKFHKLRNTESACTEEPVTGDEDDEVTASSISQAVNPLPEMDPSGSGLPHPSRLPPVDSKHLIEVKSATAAEKK